MLKDVLKVTHSVSDRARILTQLCISLNHSLHGKGNEQMKSDGKFKMVRKQWAAIKWI